MNVQLVYRNYKPLHDLYRSLWIDPPPLVSYAIPRPLRIAHHLYPLYLAFGDWPPARSLMPLVQSLFFGGRQHEGRTDIIHYVQMVPGKTPSIPYVVDFEHAAALANFVKLANGTRERILRFLKNEHCRGILPLTAAAQESLFNIFPKLDIETVSKVEVIYPALPNYSNLWLKRTDGSSSAWNHDKLKFLFVGNDVYRKGLPELMAAFRILEKRHTDIELCVVSDAPEQLKNKFSSSRIKHFDPVYPFDQMIEKFYLACDILALPTHCDTFGMAILCALSCGKPVVTTDQYASPELVRNGENGLLVRSNRLLLENVCMPDRAATKAFITHEVDTLLIDELTEKLGYICTNRGILKQMSEAAAKDFKTDGKFSISERNRKLTEAYGHCIKAGVQSTTVRV
jgi:glycosyltransferase involved in cell wall biosynthesis